MSMQVTDIQACHDRAWRMRLPELAGELRELLGAKLVAYIGSVSETRAVREWSEGRRAPGSSQVRLKLRLAYEIAACIAEADGREIAQAWFQGLNPLLDDVSPARLLREGEYEEVGPLILRAGRQFVAQG
jgi:hypothetical protein